jgi:CubicO group peptidase (beta-lactamase class C family)
MNSRWPALFLLWMLACIAGNGLHGGDARRHHLAPSGATLDRIPAPPVQECLAFADPGEDEQIGIVRDYVQSQYGPPAAGIAIVDDGVLAATSGIGGADGETMFWVASTSKFVTAVGALALMEQGLLDQRENA